jgi:hypothetical protein
MALVVKDRVKESTTSTGTGTITLGGTFSGFQDFSAIGDGNTTYYTITDGTNWEVGIGTYTASGTTLSRDTVLESSNSGSLVNFGAGTKDVFVTYPAERAVYYQTASASNINFVFTSTVVGSGGTSNWTQATGADPWIATKTVTGILSTDRPTVSLDISSETYADGLFLQTVWNYVYRVEASANNEIKLYSIEEPVSDFDIVIQVVR